MPSQHHRRGGAQRQALTLTKRQPLVWCVMLALAAGSGLAQAQPSPLVAPAMPAAAARVPAPPTGQAESLAALLARALPQDPAVQVARALLSATDERRWQARSRLGPALTVNATAGKSLDTELNLPVNRTTDRAELGLRWNLYNAGSDGAELTAVSREVEAAWQDLRRAREESAERVADAYLELLRGEALVPLAAERRAAVQRLVDQVLQQNSAGKVSDADAQQARASLLDAEIAQEQAESERDSARQKLARLVGDEIRPVAALSLPVPLDDSGSPGLVASAQLRALAARDRVRPRSTLLAPRVDLELRKSLGDRTFPAQTTLQQHAWVLSARWDLPLGGENASRLDEAARRAEAAEADAERVARGVRAELDALLPTLDNTARAIERLDRQIAQYTSIVRSGELQFEAGRRTLAQLIQLHDSRFNAQQRLADQTRKLQGAQLRRLSLTGTLLSALGLPPSP